MYVDLNTIIEAGKVLSAVTAFVLLMWRLFVWLNKQKELAEKLNALEEQQKKDAKEIRRENSEALARLEKKHDHDIKVMTTGAQKSTSAMQEELTLITYGLLACLQGLQGMIEQPGDDSIPKAIDKIYKYLNQKAHDQQ